ncbi:nitrate transporter [Phlyctema vagabunda]|uniref:Nitrate/nitrite transporter n=1 Tax=Phlyctema vagabunda TaxID=108571 RepID=A0ABR4PF12_9HELO
MGFKIATLWQAPEVNPVNHKARSIPILNVVNIYGRVFFFGWFGFFVAFWSWYAFPPLLSHTIKKDLKLSPTNIANSNIVSLCATLLVRFVAGPLCDLIGPRYTFALTLLIGAIPTALAGTISSVSGLYTIRFFVGILGGSFVPCQVWSTAFFDKNVVGTANALAGGWGNSGGGITYFVMPAIYDSFVRDHGLTEHVAWRVTFIVPFIVIVSTAALMVMLCPDTPTGKWSERHLHVQESLQAHGLVGGLGQQGIIGKEPGSGGMVTPPRMVQDEEKLREEAAISGAKHNFDHEAPMSENEMIEVAKGETVEKPSFKESARILGSLQVFALGFAYFNSFGAELAINSILGAYYLKNFPAYGQTGNANWAAMFGLLNIVTRPLGGIIADILYRRTHSVWVKKMWIHFVGIMAGVFLIVIGVTDPHDHSTLIGLIAGMAVFLEAGNGANYALVPHVWPKNNGVVSGTIGATGNMGGVVYAIVFRYMGRDYAKAIMIIGIMMIGMNLVVSWIPPINKRQIGGR